MGESESGSEEGSELVEGLFVRGIRRVTHLDTVNLGALHQGVRLTGTAFSTSTKSRLSSEVAPVTFVTSSVKLSGHVRPSVQPFVASCPKWRLQFHRGKILKANSSSSHQSGNSPAARLLFVTFSLPLVGPDARSWAAQPGQLEPNGRRRGSVQQVR